FHAAADIALRGALAGLRRKIDVLHAIAWRGRVGDVVAGDVQRPLEREQARDAGGKNVTHPSNLYSVPFAVIGCAPANLRPASPAGARLRTECVTAAILLAYSGSVA